MMGLGVDCHAARARIGNGADRMQRVEVEDQDLWAARNIEAALIIVGIDIIDGTDAHDLCGIDDFVRLDR